MNSRTPAIETEQLTKCFGSLKALDQLTMTVPKGIVFGFLGPNGAGKTTTIRLLLGLSKPNEGNARIFGSDCFENGNQVRESSGFLLENHGLYERVSALYNLEYYADIYHLSPGDKKERIRNLLEIVELWDRRNEKIKDWSRGMKQKLALVRAMIHHPRILFLDEPTLGLDVATAHKIRNMIKSLSENDGCTIFLTSHNLSEVEQICNKVAIIHKGRLMAMGAITELKSRQGYREVRITGNGFSPKLQTEIETVPGVRKSQIIPSQTGDSSDLEMIIRMDAITPLNDLMRTIIDSGIFIRNLDVKNQSLEGIFLELTNDQEEEK